MPPYNKQLQRTVGDKVPSHMRLRAAAELRRYTPTGARHCRHQCVALFVVPVAVVALASQSSRVTRVFCQRSGSALSSAALSASVEWALAKRAVSERAGLVVSSASGAVSETGRKSQRGLAVEQPAGVLSGFSGQV
jgi:hypothetical protein